MPVNLIYSFSPNTTINPDEVNANFDTIASHINANVAHLEGAAFTSVPTVATAPSLPEHVATKAYVDSVIANALASKLSATKGTYTDTTSPTGLAVVHHGLGTNVAGAVCTTNGTQTLFGGAAVEGKVVDGNASTVTFKFWNGTSPFASQMIRFHWIAWS